MSQVSSVKTAEVVSDIESILVASRDHSSDSSGIYREWFITGSLESTWKTHEVLSDPCEVRKPSKSLYRNISIVGSTSELVFDITKTVQIS